MRCRWTIGGAMAIAACTRSDPPAPRREAAPPSASATMTAAPVGVEIAGGRLGSSSEEFRARCRARSHVVDALDRSREDARIVSVGPPHIPDTKSSITYTTKRGVDHPFLGER